ncbi:ATP-binding cassette domain-containing protein [Phytoactinopolyspora limicola]|uniref:ATP-binding cassette domain-containing protein n=1 Tax=Phytoactinopolyspora limicola TaxID=2715536 RepID=UPI00140E187D|nr:ATP-binding cassette domain-containing protein [Phytoactinopolyspora limicola]
MNDAGLTVRGLRVSFGGSRGMFGRGGRPAVAAVAGVDLDVAAGEIVAVVGESGSGKTTVARCVVGLVTPDDGTLSYDDVPLGSTRSRPPAIQRAIQMVFQDPRSSLNPRMTAGAIVREAWQAHPAAAPSGDQDAAVRNLLAEVGLDASVAGRRPSALSGGQCQRVSIARALALRPRLLVCDEAVSALDVSVQAQILRLLSDVRRDHGLSMLFISHDLGVVRQIADRVVVMRSGEVVEQAPAEDLFTRPTHPYTRALLDAALDLEGAAS